MYFLKSQIVFITLTVFEVGIQPLRDKIPLIRFYCSTEKLKEIIAKLKSEKLVSNLKTLI